MNQTELKNEILKVVDLELTRLQSLGEIDAERKAFIEEYISLNFSDDSVNSSVLDKLNQLIKKFDELYIPLTSINLSKYTPNA